MTDTQYPLVIEHYRKIPESEHAKIIHAFTVELETIISLSARYGVSRQAIYKILRLNGVDTTKSGTNAWHTVSCHHCGAPVLVRRARLRNKNNLFCGNDCWLQYLNSISSGKLDRYGMMVGRETVRTLWPGLQPGMVVHHIDGDDKNNNVSNLLVYATQGDHLRAHRGYPADPVWVGAEHIELWQALVDSGEDFHPTKRNNNEKEQ